MPVIPEPITALTAALGKLPGIGPRSAERIALHLVQAEEPAVRQLAQVILNARDASLGCVVERPTDILSIEKANSFRGKYHVLGGKISPLNGVEPEDLRIGQLETRLTREPIKEVVLALPTDVEG